MAFDYVAGDLVLSADGTQFESCAGPRRVAQIIMLEFATPAGTDRYDSTRGFDWLSFMRKYRTSAERRAMIRAKLLSVDGVNSVQKIVETIDKLTRTASYAYTVGSDVGQVSGDLAFPLVTE